MILTLASGQALRGDLIKSAVLRSDLSPIPVTLEASIRADGDMARHLAEGKQISVNNDVLSIIKSVLKTERAAQGSSEVAHINITAILASCRDVAFVRSRAIIKENVTLSSIYRASGASLKSVDADFPIPRFYCPIGETPSFHIARALQEEGGIVRWKNGRLKFFRLQDLFRQAAVAILPNNASDDVDSGFTERHELPWFFSLNEAGAFVYGNQLKPRSVQYAPFKNVQRLHNMSRSLVRRKVQKIDYAGDFAAGDLVNFMGGVPLCVITAAHVFESGTDGGSPNQYTRLWLGEMV